MFTSSDRRSEMVETLASVENQGYKDKSCSAIIHTSSENFAIIYFKKNLAKI